MSNMASVRNQLGEILQAVQNLTDATASAAPRLGRDLGQMGNQSARGVSKAASTMNQFAAAAKTVKDKLNPLKAEFRALRAEARNIDFGDIADTRRFKQATAQVKAYTDSLKQLGRQIEGDSAAEREFSAAIKRQIAISKTQIELQKQQRNAAQAAEQYGQFEALHGIGKRALAPLVSQGKEATNVFAKFDDAMSEVAAISGSTGAELEALRQKSKDLGATTRYTAYQAAKAESALASAGFTSQEILTGVGPALQMASAGALGLEESAAIAASTLRGMKLQVEDLGHATDVLAYIAAATNSNIQQTGTAMEYVAPNAAIFGASLEETTAILGAMSNASIAADKGGTALRAMFLRLADPPKKGKAAVEEFGLQLTDASGNMLNIIDILQQVSDKLQLDPEALKQIQAVADQGDEAIEGLVSQSRQIKALSGLFGTTAVSGAAAAISQIKEVKRLSIAAQASSTPVEEMVTYFTKLKGIKIAKGQDVFGAIVEQAPSYQAAVEMVNQANLDLMQGHLKALAPEQLQSLRGYFTNAKGLKIEKADDFLTTLIATSPSANAAISQITTAMDTLGIRMDRDAGAAKTMAVVMENNLAGSFRSLGSAFEAVQISLIEPLAPMIRSAADAITKFLLFIANMPSGVRTAIAITSGLVTALATLAVTVGFTGMMISKFAQSLATAKAASLALSRSAIPLTGFYEASMLAFTGTNPLPGVLSAISGLARQMFSPLTLLSSALRTVGTILVGAVLNPVGLTLLALTGLYVLVQAAIPQLNVLGAVFGAIAAPIGFLTGLIKGLISGALEPLFKAFGTETARSLAAPFETLINALSVAAKAFTAFSNQGEAIGRVVGNYLVIPFLWAGSKIVSLWSKTVGAIAGVLKPLADVAAVVGRLMLASLAENSPGLTWLLRHIWKFTVSFIKGLLFDLPKAAARVGASVFAYLNDAFGKLRNSATQTWGQIQQVSQNAINTGMLVGIDAISSLATEFERLQGVASRAWGQIQQVSQNAINTGMLGGIDAIVGLLSGFERLQAEVSSLGGGTLALPLAGIGIGSGMSIQMDSMVAAVEVGGQEIEESLKSSIGSAVDFFSQAIADISNIVSQIIPTISNLINRAIVAPFDYATRSTINFTLNLLGSFEYFKDYVKALGDPDISGITKLGMSFNYFVIKPLDAAFNLLAELKRGLIQNFGLIESILLTLSTIPLSLTIRNLLYVIPASLVETGSAIAKFMSGPMTAFAYLLPIAVATAISEGLVTHVSDAIVGGIKSAILYSISTLPPIMYTLADAFSESFADTSFGKKISETSRSIGQFFESLRDDVGPIEGFFDALDQANTVLKNFYSQVLALADNPILLGRSILDIFQASLTVGSITSLLKLGALNFVKPVLNIVGSTIKAWYTLVTTTALTALISAVSAVISTIRAFGKAAVQVSSEVAAQASVATRQVATSFFESAEQALASAFAKSEPVVKRYLLKFSAAFISYIKELPFGEAILLPLMRGFIPFAKLLFMIGKAAAIFSYNFVVAFIKILPVRTIFTNLLLSLKESFGEILAVITGGFSNTFEVVSKISSLFKYLNPVEFIEAYKQTQGFLSLGYKYLTPIELLFSHLDESIYSIRKAKLAALLGRAITPATKVAELEKDLAVITRIYYYTANYSVVAASVFVLASSISVLGYALIKSGLAAKISVGVLALLGNTARHSGDAAFYLFGQLGKVAASIPFIQKISKAISPVSDSITAISDAIAGFLNDNFYGFFSRLLEAKDAVSQFVKNLVGSFIVGFGVLFAVFTLFYARMNPLRIFEGISKAFKTLVIQPIVGTVGAIKGLISSIVELTKVLTPLGTTFIKSGRQSEQFQLELDQTSLTIGKQGGMVKRLAELFRIPVTPEFDLERMKEQLPRKRELADLYQQVRAVTESQMKAQGVTPQSKNRFGKAVYSREQIDSNIERVVSDSGLLRSLAFGSGGKQIAQMAKTNQVDALRMLFTDKGRERFLEGGEAALKEMNLRADKVEISADFLNAKTKGTSVSGTLVEVNSSQANTVLPIPGLLAMQRNLPKDSLSKFGLPQNAAATSFSDALGRRSNDQLAKWATEFGAKMPDLKSLPTMDDKQLLAFLKKNYSITAAAQSLMSGAVTGLNPGEIENILGVSTKELFSSEEFKRVDQRQNLTPVELDQKQKKRAGLFKNIYLDALSMKGRTLGEGTDSTYYDYLRSLKDESDEGQRHSALESLRVLKKAVHAQELELYESTRENILKIIDVISADPNISFGNLSQSDIRRQSKVQLVEKILQEKAAYQDAFKILAADAIRMGELAESVRDLGLNLPVPPPVKPLTKGLFSKSQLVKQPSVSPIEDIRAEKLTARAFDVGFNPERLARIRSEAKFLQAFVATKIVPNATDEQIQRDLLNQIGDVREIAKGLGIAYDVAGTEREQEISALRGLMNTLVESLHEAKALSRREMLDAQADIQANLGGAIKYFKEGDEQYAIEARKYQIEREAKGGVAALAAQAIPIPQEGATDTSTQAALERRARVTRFVEQGQLEELASSDLLAIAKAARMNVVELLQPNLPEIPKRELTKTGVLRRQFLRSRMTERGINSSQDLINKVFDSFKKEGVNVKGGKESLQRDFAAILQGRSFDVDTQRLQRFAEILSLTGRKAADAAVELESEISAHSLLASQLNVTRRTTNNLFKDLTARQNSLKILAAQSKEEQANRVNLEKQRLRSLMGLAYEFTGKDPREYLQQNNIPIKELITGTLDADQTELERIAGLLKTTVGRLQSLEKYRESPRTARALDQFETQYKQQDRLAAEQAKLTPQQIQARNEYVRRLDESRARRRQTVLASEQFVAPASIKQKEAAQAQFEKVKAELVSRFQIEAQFIDRIVSGQIKTLDELSDTEREQLRKIANYANVAEKEVIAKRQPLVPASQSFSLKMFMSQTSTIEQFEQTRNHLINQLGVDSDFLNRLIEGRIKFNTELSQVERRYVSEIAKYANITENDVVRLSDNAILPNVPITQRQKTIIRLKNKISTVFSSVKLLGEEYNQRVNTSLSYLMREAGYGKDFNLLIEILRTEGVKTGEIQALLTGPDQFKQQLERDRKKAQRTISKTLQDLLYDNNEAVRIAFKGTVQEAIAALQQVGVSQEKIDFLVGKAYPAQKTATELMNLSEESVRIIADVLAVDPDKLKQAYTIKTPRGGFGAFLLGKGAQLIRKQIGVGLDSIKGLISAQYRQAAVDMQAYQRSLSQQAQAKRKAAAQRDAAILREIAAEILKFGARGQLNWLSQNAAEQAYQLGAVINKYRGRIPGAGLLEDSIYKLGQFLGREAKSISATIDNLPSIGQRFVALKQKIVDSLANLMNTVSTKYQEGIQAVNRATDAVKSYTPNWLKVAVSKIWKYTIGGLASAGQKLVKNVQDSIYAALPSTKRKATEAAIAQKSAIGKTEGESRRAALAAMDEARLAARQATQVSLKPPAPPSPPLSNAAPNATEAVEQARIRGRQAGIERQMAASAIEQARLEASTRSQSINREKQIQQLTSRRIQLEKKIGEEEAKLGLRSSEAVRKNRVALIEQLREQRNQILQQTLQLRKTSPVSPVINQALESAKQKQQSLNQQIAQVEKLPTNSFKEMSAKQKKLGLLQNQLNATEKKILELTQSDLKNRAERERADKKVAIVASRAAGLAYVENKLRNKNLGRQRAIDIARQRRSQITSVAEPSAAIPPPPAPVDNVYVKSQRALANFIKKAGERYADRQEKLAAQSPDVVVRRPKQLYSYTKVQRDESGQMTGYAPLSGTRGFTQETYPSQVKATYLRLAQSARETAGQIALFFENSADQTEQNWQNTGQKISGRIWKAPLASIYVIGKKIQKFFSEGSPGPSYYTRQNWEHTADSVEQNLGEVAATASHTGKQVQSAMVGAATRSGSAFAQIRGAITSVGRAGMKIGGVVTAAGFAAQTVSFSLSNLGILDEETSQALYKFTEIFTIVGAVGGLAAPILGAVGSALGALLTVGGLVIGAVFSPIGLAIAAIGIGLVVLNAAIRKLTGINILGRVFESLSPRILRVFSGMKVAASGALTFINGIWTQFVEKFGSKLSPIVQPVLDMVKPFVTYLVDAAGQIQSAWQGFVDWFSNIPLVAKAIEIAQGLISALNCYPTEVIPLAWEGAVSRITQWLGGLPIIGGLISGELIKSFDPSLIFSNFWEQAKKLSKFFPWMKDEVTQMPQAPASIEPGPVEQTKDYQAELRRAIGVAKAQQNQNAIESLQAIASSSQGQLTPSQYAVVTAPENQVGGGSLLAQEVKLTQQREVRDRVVSDLQTLGNFAIGNSNTAQAKASIKGLIKETTSGAMLLEKTGANFKSASGAIANKIDDIDKQIAQAGGGGVFGKSRVDAKKLAITKEGLVEQLQRDFPTVLSDQQRQFLIDVGVSPDGVEQVISQIGDLTNNVQNEFGDRWLALQRSNGEAVRDIFKPGIAQMKNGFSVLGGDVADFAKRSAKALFTLNFNELGQAAKDFGGNAAFALGMIRDGFGSASLSAIAFGVYTLLGLNPVLLVLGGIALGALAIAFNFLGIRTIISGLIGVIKGLIKLFVSTIQFAVQLGRAFRTITQGIFSLDFSMIRQGAAQAFGAVGMYVQRVKESLTQTLGGAIRVLQGLFEGLGQIGNTALQAIGLRSSVIGDTFNRVVSSAMYLGSALMAIVTKPQLVWQKLKALLDQIWGRITEITNKVTAAAGNVGEAVKGSVVGRAVRAAQKRVSGESPTLSDARAAVDFEERIKGKEPGLTISDRAAQTKKGLRGFVGGLFKKRNQEVETVAEASINTPEPVAEIPAAQTRRGILSRMKLRKQEAQEAVAAEQQIQEAVSQREAALSATGQAVSSLGTVMSALMPQLSGPIMLAGTLVDAFTSIPDAISGLKETKAGFSEISTSIQSGVLGISNRIKTAWVDTLKWFASLSLSQKAAGLLQNANDAIASSVSSLKSVIKNAWVNIVASYNQGGIAAVIAKSIAAANAFISNTFKSLATGARLLWTELVAGYTSGGIIGAIKAVYQFLAVKLFAKTASAQAAVAQAAVEVPANTAIAASEQAVATAATQAGVAQVNGAIASSTAATAEASVVGGANTFMSLTFGALATAAGTAWAAITGPLLPIIIAIGTLVAVVGGIYLIFKTNFAGIGTLFATFWKSITQLGSSIMTLFSPLMPLIKLVGGLFVAALLSPILLIVGALTLVVQGINAVVQGVIAIASTAFKFLWDLIPQPLRWLLEQASQGISFAINALFGGDKGAQQQTEELPQFAVGGPVSANTPGGPVAAILHDNEFVMNPDATRENYGLLQLLNSGVSAEDAIRMIPTTPPELVMPTGNRGGAAIADTKTESPKIELNITFTGDIILGGNNNRENAREFMNLIGPEIEELVVEAMRQRGEFSR